MSHDAWFQPWLNTMGTLHPLIFLRRFSPVHSRWHSFPRSQRPVGFLTFHKEILVAFTDSLTSIGSAGMLPPPRDENDPDGPYDGALDNINDLTTFSQSIEIWHNQIHMQHPDPDMADPRVNIYLLEFWALHRLIDQKFDECLARNRLTFARMPANLHATV
jgi:hypothetical protein